MPENQLPIGPNDLPTTPDPNDPNNAIRDYGNIKDLFAGGEFRNLHFPVWKVEIRHVKDVVGFLTIMQQVAEVGKTNEAQITAIRQEIDALEKQIADTIASRYLTVDANGQVVPTPEGLALIADDPVYRNLPEEDRIYAAVGRIQIKVSALIAKAKASDSKLMALQSLLNAAIAGMAKLQSDALSKVENIIGKSIDISDKVCSITCDMTDDKMAQADFTFFDPSTEFFDAIGQWDMVKIALGWRDAPDSERYKLGPVFEGIVTSKQGQQTGSATSSTAITATDFKIFMNLTKTKTVYGSDEGTNTAKFIEDMFEKAGLSNDSSKMELDITGKNVLYNQTLLNYVEGRASGLNHKISTIRDTGVTTFMSLPQEFRDKAFIFKWFHNIISFTSKADWPLASEDEKEGAESGVPDPNHKPVPPSEDPPPTGEPPTSMGTGPMGALAERINKYMKTLKSKNDGRKLTASIVIRGEPRMTNESLMFIDDLSKGKNGIYKVVSCKHSTSPTFTTSCEIEYLQIPPLTVDLENLAMVHGMLNEGQPSVIKDTSIEGPNDTVGPSRVNYLSSEVNSPQDPTLWSAT